MFGYLSRSALTLGIISGWNFCPPKPGSTVITSTMSTLSASQSACTASPGVPGLSATPARIPAARALSASPAASLVASTWKVNIPAPAARSGST